MKLISIIFIVLLLIIFFFSIKKASNTSSQLPTIFPTGEEVRIIKTNLAVPWEIEFLNNSILITQRNGLLTEINLDKKEIDIKIEDVLSVGEGGLLGMMLHPDFKNNGYIYLYFTYQNSGKLFNKVERYKYINHTLVDKVTIVDKILASKNHNGGRIKFGPDGNLYITTGDAEKSNLSQDINSLNGKILRLKDDGSIPPDNPFTDSPVYAWGLRNPQGLTWDNEENLWSTDHGRSGIQSGYDEISLIQKGANYGWPQIEGDKEKQGMEIPVINSGPNDTWAPSSIEYFKGKLYFTGLKGESLYETTINANHTLSTPKKIYFKSYGRLRDIKIYNNNLYLLTSNRDGRGKPQNDDDKIIEITNPTF